MRRYLVSPLGDTLIMGSCYLSPFRNAGPIGVRSWHGRRSTAANSSLRSRFTTHKRSSVSPPNTSPTSPVLHPSTSVLRSRSIHHEPDRGLGSGCETLLGWERSPARRSRRAASLDRGLGDRRGSGRLRSVGEIGWRGTVRRRSSGG
jgi:hypothetical protein